jgi:methionine-rich copper-binding protein CopC
MNWRTWLFGTMFVPLTVFVACSGGGGVTPQNNGGGGTDTIPPTLTSSVPANGAMGVTINGAIKLVFSEKMDTASVSVTSDPNGDLGAAAWNPAGTELRFQPPTNLEPSATYTLSVEGKDVAGNALDGGKTVQFVTANEVAPPDTTSPSIVSSSPENGGTNTAINSNILVTFSEAMKPASITVSLSPSVNLGAATFKSENSAVEFDPPADLAGDTSYTVTVGGTDAAGNALTGPNSFTFKTATTQDTTAPGTPQNLTAEAGEGQVKLTWIANTEPDLKGYTIYYGTDAANLSSNIFVSKPSSSKVVSNLTNGTKYFFALAAEDGAGNRSGRSTTVNATPKDVTAPKLISSTPANNASNVPVETVVEFRFNEPLDQTFSTISVNCAPLTGSCYTGFDPAWKNDKTLQVLFTQTRGLGSNSKYKIDVSVKDKAGNRTESTINFTVIELPRPSVVSVSPAPNVIGQSPTTPIVLNFSKPMDRFSTERAFKINYGLLGGGATVPGTFVWSNTDTTMTFQPNPMAFGEIVLFRLLFGATDKIGLSITAETIQAFRVIQQVTLDLPSFGSGYITRKCIATSCDDTANQGASVNVIGDFKDVLFPLTTNRVYGWSKTYLSFLIKGIPSNATVTAARLQLPHVRTNGDPFGTLGGAVILERVDVPTVIENGYLLSGNAGHFNLPPLACAGCPISIPSVTVDQNVLGFVQAARSESRALAQFRLHMAQGVSLNGQADSLEFSKEPTLTITYQVP